MTKRDETEQLLAAVISTQAQHSRDGWWCDLDQTACGSTLDAFCPCCKRAYAGLAGEPGGDAA